MGGTCAGPLCSLIVAGGLVIDTGASAAGYTTSIYIVSPYTGNWFRLTPTATNDTTVTRSASHRTTRLFALPRFD